MFNYIQYALSSRFKNYRKKLEIQKDGKFSLVFTANQLPDMENSPAFRYKLLHGKIEVGQYYICKSNGEGQIFLGILEKKYNISGHNIYVRSTCRSYILLDGKRLVVNNINSDMVNFIISLFKLEALYASPLGKKDKSLVQLILLTNKTVLRQILQGKITNRRDLVKKWAASSYKIKTFDYLDLEICMEQSYIPIGRIVFFSENIASSLRAIAELARQKNKTAKEKLNLMSDLYSDAIIFKKKINARWSLNRMRDEHEKNIKAMLPLLKDGVSSLPILQQDTNGLFDGYASIKGRLLNSEKDVYEEAICQKNCLYTHYCKAIMFRQYFALSITRPERLTVGIRFHGEDLIIDQMLKAHNLNIDPATEHLLLEWFNNVGRKRLSSILQIQNNE